MDIIKRKLSRTRSAESNVSATGSTVSKARGRRGGFTAFHVKKANLSKELLQAIKNGDVTKLRASLEAGSEFEDMDEVNRAVKIACEKGYIDILATLIRHGAAVNAMGEDNMAPLHIATRHGSLSVITLLIGHGANLNIQTKFDKRTAIHMAALSGREDSLRLLLEANKSTNLDMKDIYGSTALHMAARMGHLSIVSLFLSHKGKCDVNAYDNEGWTALHLAAERGDKEMTQLLIDNFAQIDCQNKYGRTPLHWSTIQGHPDIVRILLQYKASATLKDLHNKCALEYAKEAAIKQMLKMTPSVIHKAPIAQESSIGSFLKIDPRESFIKRLAQPLPQTINTIASIKRKPDPTHPENLDTIAEETEIGSGSRKSSLLSEDEAFVDHDISDESITKDKASPFVRAIFQRKNSSDASSAASSRRNSTNSKSDLESSYKSNCSARSELLCTSVGNKLGLQPGSLNNLQSGPISRSLQDLNEDDTAIPEAALLGKVQFRSFLGRIKRHQQAMETIINSVSMDVAQAVTGRSTMSNENLMNVSNRLHKLQDLMFDFREENDRQAVLIKNTMQNFLDTIKDRLSSRDAVPVWIHHAFLHASTKYLCTHQHGWKTVIQRIPMISEEKRSDLLQQGNSIPETATWERCNMAIQFALSNVQESDRDTPLKALLLLITKCGFQPNSAQIILKSFIHAVHPTPQDCLQHDNIFPLSYRLGKDGDALGGHFGVPNEGENISPFQRQETNLAIISKWRQASAQASVVECVYDLIEGLVVIGREDLLVWVLSTQKRRAFSADMESQC